MCGNDKSFPCFKVGGNDAGTTRSFPPIFEGWKNLESKILLAKISTNIIKGRLFNVSGNAL